MLTFHYDKLDSTSEQGKRLAARYRGQRLLVTAKCQTAGRGRSGRLWQSPVGGAWFTLVWPIERAVEATSIVPLLVGREVLRAVRKTIGSMHALKIKWPNDVLLGSEPQKIAGVLCEQWLHDRDGLDRTLCIGVGINVNFGCSELSHDLHGRATTLLSAIGSSLDVSRLIELCVRYVASALDETNGGRLSAARLQDLEAHLAWLNEPICLRSGDRLIKGICRGLDPSGRIQILVGQQLRLFDAGEVSQLRIDAVQSEPCVRVTTS